MPGAHSHLRILLTADVLGLLVSIGTAQASPPPGTWHQVFGDEFNGSSLDTSTWSTCRGTTCTNTRELEWYQAANVTESGGLLHLTAKHETASVGGRTYDYTSGMICGCGPTGKVPPSFSFKYGYAEISAQVPAGQGLWPAYWMLPASYKWPPEIDVMEEKGQDPFTNYMSVHWGPNKNGFSTGSYTGPDNFSLAQHTYGVDWEPGAIVWYVDGVERYRYSVARNVPSQPMYLLANLAVGGDFVGPPDANTPFPSELAVDYIRVYQH
jgi:beta-glucanase (GH16 family)